MKRKMQATAWTMPIEICTSLNIVNETGVSVQTKHNYSLHVA